MTDIEKLLEERGKIHGDPETTHALVHILRSSIYHYLLNNPTILEPAVHCMIDEILLNLCRGIYNRKHLDNWDDIAGYAMLIRKTYEPGNDGSVMQVKYKDPVTGEMRLEPMSVKNDLGNPQPPSYTHTVTPGLGGAAHAVEIDKQERGSCDPPSKRLKCEICLQWRWPLVLRDCLICNKGPFCPDCWDGHETEHPNVE